MITDFAVSAVFNGSKILIWKQITTQSCQVIQLRSCFQWFKDTNLKANHNTASASSAWINAVFNGSKILIWKQITTCRGSANIDRSCFQWFKDTNLKANHNLNKITSIKLAAVFNGSKILIWKQITTYPMTLLAWFMLFSMVQRY